MQANDTQSVVGYYTFKIKRVSDWYWYYYNFCKIEQQKVRFLIFYNKLWWQYYIWSLLFLYIICHSFYHKFRFSDLLLFLSQCLKQSKNNAKFYFQFWSTPELLNTYFLFRIISKHRTAEWWQGSDNCGGLDLNTVVNLPFSGKLCQSTTISSQCENCS